MILLLWNLTLQNGVYFIAELANCNISETINVLMFCLLNEALKSNF